MRSCLLRAWLVVACLVVAWLLPAAAHAQVVVAAGGGQPAVRILNADGSQATFFAFNPAFTGGVRAALGDVNGDGVVDIVTAAGPGGGPHVKVFSGADLSELASFYAYAPAPASNGVLPNATQAFTLIVTVRPRSRARARRPSRAREPSR
jgi:hypothetical protein